MNECTQINANMRKRCSRPFAPHVARTEAYANAVAAALHERGWVPQACDTQAVAVPHCHGEGWVVSIVTSFDAVTGTGTAEPLKATGVYTFERDSRTAEPVDFVWPSAVFPVRAAREGTAWRVAVSIESCLHELLACSSKVSVGGWVCVDGGAS